MIDKRTLKIAADCIREVSKQYQVDANIARLDRNASPTMLNSLREFNRLQAALKIIEAEIYQEAFAGLAQAKGETIPNID